MGRDPGLAMTLEAIHQEQSEAITTVVTITGAGHGNGYADEIENPTGPVERAGP